VIKNGMSAVDLGAAPGGWGWQLAQRGLLVTAIDNGPRESKVMQSAMVEQSKTDAFTYRPKKPVDWLVCDMAERPLLVSKLIAKWFTREDCRNAIFNLKLPIEKTPDSRKKISGKVSASIKQTKYFLHHPDEAALSRPGKNHRLHNDLIENAIIIPATIIKSRTPNK